MLRLGSSQEFGARELKRTILRKLTQPLAAMVESGRAAPQAHIHADVAPDGDNLTFETD